MFNETDIPFKNNNTSVGQNLYFSKMTALQQNVANCQSTLTVLTMNIFVSPSQSRDVPVLNTVRREHTKVSP